MIEGTGFGWIVIDGKRYNSDVLILATGEIKDRYENFSGSSHSLSKIEVDILLTGSPEVIIVGTGQAGCLVIPKEIKDYIKKKDVSCLQFPTPEAIKVFNQEKRKKSALFHLTC